MPEEEYIGVVAYFERIWAEHAKVHDLEHAALVNAAASLANGVSHSAAVTDKRLDAMNEFRSQLRDQTASFITREVFERNDNRIADRMNGMDRILTNLVSKAEIEKLEANAKERADRGGARLDKLENWMAATGGREKGVGMVWGVILGGGALMVAVIGTVIAVANN